MILHRILSNLLIYLAITIVIEAVSAFILSVRNGYGQLIVLLANVITNPILNCTLIVVSFYLSKSLYYVFLVPLEILAVVIEGLIYRKTLSLKMNPFLFSLILNACSYFIGMLIYKLIF